jgi:hypothetical protein
MGAGGDRRLDLQNLSTIVTLFAGVVSGFYVVGLLILGLRLQQYGFPVEAVVSQLPQTFLAVVGLTEIGMPLTLVAGVYLMIRLLTQGGRARSRDHGLLQKHSLVVASVEVFLVVLITGVVLAVERQSGIAGQPWGDDRLWLAAGAGAVGLVMGWCGLWISYHESDPTIDRSKSTEHEHRHGRDTRCHTPNHSHARGQVSDPASRGNATLATLSAMLAVFPILVFNAITLPLTDAKLCPTSSSGKATSGWLIGATSDRFYLGSASSPRYIAAAAASNFTLLEGNEDLHLASKDPASVAPDVKAACPAVPSPSPSASP